MSAIVLKRNEAIRYAPLSSAKAVLWVHVHGQWYLHFLSHSSNCDFLLIADSRLRDATLDDTDATWWCQLFRNHRPAGDGGGHLVLNRYLPPDLTRQDPHLNCIQVILWFRDNIDTESLLIDWFCSTLGSCHYGFLSMMDTTNCTPPYQVTKTWRETSIFRAFTVPLLLPLTAYSFLLLAFKKDGCSTQPTGVERKIFWIQFLR